MSKPEHKKKRFPCFLFSITISSVFLFYSCKPNRAVDSDYAITPTVTIEAYSSQPVYAGGVWSLNKKGMDDLAVPGNSESFRAKGGRLYIHELGWDNTSKTGQATIAGLFPAPPMWESSYSDTNGAGHMMEILTTRLVKYWSKADYLTVNFLSDKSTAQMQEVRDLTKNMVGKVAPIFSPNSGSWNGAPWSSTKWNQIRTNAKIGGALATDSPPYFYLSQPEGYKEFVAGEMKWCKANNIDMIAIIHPGLSVDFNEDFRKYRADLKSRGAVPDIWAVECYYGNAGGLHLIGSEKTENDLMYTALKNLELKTPDTKTFAFANSPIADPPVSAEFHGTSDLVISISGLDTLTENRVTKAELYLNDQPVRALTQSPFVWNKSGEDAILNSLTTGEYNLKLITGNAKGNTETNIIKILVSK